MYKPLLSLGIVTLITCLSNGCQTHYAHDEFTGTWRGTGHTINSRGKQLTKKFISIEIDENGLVEGRSGWELVDGSGGHDGDTPTITASEEVIGVFDPEDGELNLVETREHGILRGTVLDRDRIKMVLVQSGEKPVASTFVLTRVPPSTDSGK